MNPHEKFLQRQTYLLLFSLSLSHLLQQWKAQLLYQALLYQNLTIDPTLRIQTENDAINDLKIYYIYGWNRTNDERWKVERWLQLKQEVLPRLYHLHISHDTALLRFCGRGIWGSWLASPLQKLLSASGSPLISCRLARSFEYSQAANKFYDLYLINIKQNFLLFKELNFYCKLHEIFPTSINFRRNQKERNQSISNSHLTQDSLWHWLTVA